MQFHRSMSLITRSIAIAALTAFTGCSTTSKDVSAIYISPLQYNSYDCEQLAAEGQRIQIRASQLGGRIDESARNGNIATTAAVILFWPAAFFTGGGNKEQQAELSRLKGEQDAVEQSAIAKRCARSNSTQTMPAAPAASAANAASSAQSNTTR
jgi:hypothetical protein